MSWTVAVFIVVLLWMLAGEVLLRFTMRQPVMQAYLRVAAIAGVRDADPRTSARRRIRAWLVLPYHFGRGLVRGFTRRPPTAGEQ